MNLVLIGLAAILGFAGPPQSGFAPGPLEGRACVPADLVGLWRSQLMQADEPGVMEFSGIAPNDYFRFKADGDFIYFASNRAQTSVAAIQASLDDADRLDGVTYRTEIRDGGVLIIRRDGIPFQGFTCSVGAPKDGKVPMIWTQLVGMPAVRRVQVRLD